MILDEFAHGYNQSEVCDLTDATIGLSLAESNCFGSCRRGMAARLERRAGGSGEADGNIKVEPATEFQASYGTSYRGVVEI